MAMEQTNEWDQAVIERIEQKITHKIYRCIHNCTLITCTAFYSMGQSCKKILNALRLHFDSYVIYVCAIIAIYVMQK